MLTSHLSVYAFPIYLSSAPYMDAHYSLRWLHAKLDLARTAIAVERFRMAHGQLPHALEELVPAYIDRIPADPWKPEAPLSYEIRSHGGYAVFSRHSITHPGACDYGSKTRRDLMFSRDLVFTVTSPKSREHPPAPERQ